MAYSTLLAIPDTRANSIFPGIITSSSSSIDIAPHSRTRPPWFSHKSTPRTQAMCLLDNRIFVLSSQKHLGIKLPEKTLSRGAYSAGARSSLMRMRK